MCASNNNADEINGRQWQEWLKQHSHWPGYALGAIYKDTLEQTRQTNRWTLRLKHKTRRPNSDH